MDERLDAQLAYLRSDDRLRERAALAAELTPEERLEQAWAMSKSGAAMLEQVPEDVRARLAAHREPLGAGAEVILRRLAGLSSPGPDGGADSR